MSFVFKLDGLLFNIFCTKRQYKRIPLLTSCIMKSCKNWTLETYWDIPDFLNLKGRLPDRVTVKWRFYCS